MTDGIKQARGEEVVSRRSFLRKAAGGLLGAAGVLGLGDALLGSGDDANYGGGSYGGSKAGK